MTSACYQTFLSMCRPYALSEPWVAMELKTGAFCPPADPNPVLEILRSAHPDADLIEAGLIVENAATGAFDVHPNLRGSEVVVLPLHDLQGQRIDLMTDSGSVRGKLKPAFELLRDRHTFNALERDRSLYITADLTNTVLLRSLGLAAAPARGVSDLGDADLARLEEYFGIQRAPSERELIDAEHELDAMSPSSNGMGKQVFNRGRHQKTQNTNAARPTEEPIVLPGSGAMGDDDADAIRLVFTSWSPVSIALGELDVVSDAIAYFEQLHDFRGLELQDVHRWSPGVEVWKKLEFALAKKEPAWIKATILDSVYSDVSCIDAPRDQKLCKPNTLADATRELLEIYHDLSGSDSSRQRKKTALRNYRQATYSTILGPLLEQAQAADDPLDRMRLMHLAELGGLFSQKMVEVREQASREVVTDPDANPQKAGMAFKEVLAIGEQMVSVTRGIKRCIRPGKIVRKRAVAQPMLNVPHFAASAFTTKS